MLHGDGPTASAAQLASAAFLKSQTEVGKKMPGVYVRKAVMQLIGEGVGPARLPYIAPTAAQMDTLKASLQQWCGDTAAAIRPSWCAKL